LGYGSFNFKRYSFVDLTFAGHVLQDKTNEEQLQRPYEPIAKTLEADKENTVNPDSVHQHADILSSSEHLAPAPHKDADLNVAHVTEVNFKKSP
jgi:hypothetical protein